MATASTRALPRLRRWLGFVAMSSKTGGVAVPADFDPAPGIGRTARVEIAAATDGPGGRRRGGRAHRHRRARCPTRSATIGRPWRRRGSRARPGKRSCCRSPTGPRWWSWAPVTPARWTPMRCATRPARSPAPRGHGPASPWSCRRSAALAPRLAGQVAAEGVLLAGYTYDVLQTAGGGGELVALTLVGDDSQTADLEAGAQRGQVLAGACALSRDLANCPPAHLRATVDGGRRRAPRPGQRPRGRGVRRGRPARARVRRPARRQRRQLRRAAHDQARPTGPRAAIPRATSPSWARGSCTTRAASASSRPTAPTPR